MPTVEVSTAETVPKLVNILLQKGITSIIVTDNQTPIGIINETDILKEIVETKKNPEKIRVKDLAYTPLIQLQGDESIIYAVKVMREKRMKRAAMVKNGRLIGMLTEDLAKKMSVTS